MRFSPIASQSLTLPRNCKAKKVKCGEEKPTCIQCQRQDEACDYSIRLNWDRSSRGKRKNSQDEGETTPGSTASFISVGTPGLSSAASFTSGGTPQPMSPDLSTLSPNPSVVDPALNLSQMPHSARDFAGTNFSRQPFTGMASPLLSRNQSPASQPATPASAGWPPVLQMQMPPPTSSYRRPSTMGDPLETGNLMPDELPNKRLRLSPTSESRPAFVSVEYGSPDSSGFTPQAPSHPLTIAPTSHPQQDVRQKRPPEPWGVPFSSPFGNAATSLPLTPAASTSTMSDNDTFAIPAKRGSIWDDNDPRRMSVNSLLNADEEAKSQNPVLRRADSNQKIICGIDRGLPDLDIPKNDDQNALAAESPAILSQASFPDMTFNPSDDNQDWLHAEFGFGLTTMDSNPAGIYMEVRIPWSLTPLPTRLKTNPMDLLYFHHFIANVARILVPHDCSENPFRIILPQSRCKFLCTSFSRNYRWSLNELPMCTKTAKM